LDLAEAATIPDNFVTAYFTLFDNLRLPIPTSLPEVHPPLEKDTPILIYGSGTTVGQYLIQLLRLAGYRRILTTASTKHHDHLLSLGATEVFDYSQDDLSDQILASTNGQLVKYAVDCVTAEVTLQKIAKVVGKGSIVALLLPIKEGSTVTGAGPGGQMWSELPEDRNPFPREVELVGTKTFTYQNVRQQSFRTTGASRHLTHSYLEFFHEGESSAKNSSTASYG
jgi:NADPH:quinone reductase-like Zn-dependent oxidoreductase